MNSRGIPNDETRAALIGHITVTADQGSAASRPTHLTDLVGDCATSRSIPDHRQSGFSRARLFILSQQLLQIVPATQDV
jgi:hypothetical protein